MLTAAMSFELMAVPISECTLIKYTSDRRADYG